MLNEDTTTWIAFSPSAFDFAKIGVDQLDYNTLLSQAAYRAKAYILNCLNISQATLDNVVDGDKFQLAYQKLTAYELIQTRAGIYANTFPFAQYTSPEREEVTQDNASLERWLNIGNRLKQEALTVLEAYIPDEYKDFDEGVVAYNWV